MSSLSPGNERDEIASRLASFKATQLKFRARTIRFGDSQRRPQRGRRTETIQRPIEPTRMTTQKLQDLEQLAAELLDTARKLPQGPDRQDALKKVGSFITKIASIQRACFPQSRDQIAGA